MKNTQPRYLQQDDKLSQGPALQQDYFQSWLNQYEEGDDFLSGKVSDFFPDLSEDDE